MSFDVFFQRFVDGGSADSGNAEARLALGSHLVRDGNNVMIGLRTSDGVADVYGLDEVQGGGFMVNHISGRQIWSVLVSAARAADFAIMPAGCPVCVLSWSMLNQLPTDLFRDARVVDNGEDLLLVIGSS